MEGPSQDYLTPLDMLREELTDERLFSSHLIFVLATLSVAGCRQAIDLAPDVSERCKKEAHEYLDDLIWGGEVRT